MMVTGIPKETTMLKRNLALVLVAGLVLGGGATAWAAGDPAPTTTPTTLTPAERQARAQALKTCLQGAQDTAARKACVAAAGLGTANAAKRKALGLPGPDVLGRAIHGSLLVPGPNSTWQTVTFDRGKVDAATTGTRIVLDRADGQQVSLALTADTAYHGVDGAASLKVGQPALVVSKDGTATHVLQKVRGPKRK